MKHLTSPEQHFGFRPGCDYELARWDKIVEYFYILERESDRISVRNMGPTTEGNEFLQVVISSPENLKNLETIRQNNLKLADPRNLSQEEIDTLVKNGKAISVQSMSLHATEVGGTQMAINLAYELCAQETAQTQNILDNVVFVMVPCFNPDGELMVTDWYYRWLGTEYEGCNIPGLYHRYAGHDNNRDAIGQNVIESYYMGQLLFHQWMPQTYMDHHHINPDGARMYIAPYINPIRPYTDPITWRELSWYGASMAYKMEADGLPGISSGAKFPALSAYSFCDLCNGHNITGMLSESALAKGASPRYVDPSQLVGDHDRVQPNYEAQTNFPNPWPGGWWHFGDIVRQMYLAAYYLLETMANNREMILRNTALKALNQTERGRNSPEFAFIIPEKQHDTGEVKHLIRLLRLQNIEVHQAVEPFTVGCTGYPAGTYVVFMAQPRMGVAMNLLRRSRFPDNQWTRDASGARKAFDTATDNIAEYMNVAAIPAGQPFEGRFTLVEGEGNWSIPVLRGSKYVISAAENSAYKAVNLLLRENIPVFRIDDSRDHDFYVEGNADQIAAILEQAPTPHKVVDQRPCSLTEIKPLRIGVHQRCYFGNEDEGWIRLLMENNCFNYETVRDKEILNELDRFDVLVLSSDTTAFLMGGQHASDNLLKLYELYTGPTPPEYRSGFGLEGAKKIQQFVENGGRLIAINKSCSFAIDYLNLGVRNVVAKVPVKEFTTHGSTLKIKVDTNHPACYGMPKNALTLNWDSPAFAVCDGFKAERCQLPVKYADSDLLQSGLLDGEKYIAGKGALAICQKGKGDVVLYGCWPQFRAQTSGTFKLFFNMLYR